MTRIYSGLPVKAGFHHRPPKSKKINDFWSTETYFASSGDPEIVMEFKEDSYKGLVLAYDSKEARKLSEALAEWADWYDKEYSDA